jgi:adenylate cyclase
MESEDRRLRGSEAWWRSVLTDPKQHFEPLRPYFLRIPSAPHCKLCGAPFKGIGGAVMGPLGFRPWPKNPSICTACITDMNRQPPGGAEIECSLLFADIRGSTRLAEQASATDFAALLRRFYAVGSRAIIDQNGIVDKFVGDEVVALFIPVYAGPHHARRALRCATDLLAATGHGSAGGPWLNLGVGIHSGVAFVGTVAVGGEVSDFTALGDTVNAAARLAGQAAAGEVLVSDSALDNAGAQPGGGEHRTLALRGRQAELAVCALDATAMRQLVLALPAT